MCSLKCAHFLPLAPYSALQFSHIIYDKHHLLVSLSVIVLLWACFSARKYSRLCVGHLPEAPGVFLLTKKGRGGDGPVATWDHDTDSRLDEWHREVNNLGSLLIDGEWTHRHVGILQHHLWVKHRQTQRDRREEWKVSWHRALNTPGTMLKNKLVKGTWREE